MFPPRMLQPWDFMRAVAIHEFPATCFSSHDRRGCRAWLREPIYFWMHMIETVSGQQALQHCPICGRISYTSFIYIEGKSAGPDSRRLAAESQVNYGLVDPELWRLEVSA